MKNVSYLFCLLWLVSCSVANAQFDQENFEQLVEKRHYESAFRMLEEFDPANSDADIAILKTDILLHYFVQSIGHRLFALTDLDEGDDLYEMRSAREATYGMFMFDPSEILDSLLMVHPDNKKLNRALGEYYYEVHLKYGPNWGIPESEVLDRMNQHSVIAEEGEVADALTYYCLGYYQLVEEDWENAIPYFEKCIELDSEYVSAHYNMAICYLYNGQADKGAKSAKRSIDLYTDVTYKADAARVTAACYRESEDLENAIKYFKISDEIDPENYYTINQLLEVELKAGKAESTDRASQLFDLDPTNPRIIQTMMEIYGGQEKIKELISLLDEKKKEYMSHEEVLGNVEFHQGHIQKAEGNPKKACAHYRKAGTHFKQVFEVDHSVFGLLTELEKGCVD